jgi:hypothetical protein
VTDWRKDPDSIWHSTGLGREEFAQKLKGRRVVWVLPPFEEAVAQFADGVYYGRDSLVLGGLFDLERMEIVRGPMSFSTNEESCSPGFVVEGFEL